MAFTDQVDSVLGTYIPPEPRNRRWDEAEWDDADDFDDVLPEGKGDDADDFRFTAEDAYDDSDDYDDDMSYEYFDEVEVDNHGAVIRVAFVVYGRGENRMSEYFVGYMGKVKHFTDRPRPKREYRIKKPSYCTDGVWRFHYEGRSSIYEQQPTTTPNRQKCAGDKPKFRNGRRMARRELAKLETALMKTQFLAKVKQTDVEHWSVRTCRYGQKNCPIGHFQDGHDGLVREGCCWDLNWDYRRHFHLVCDDTFEIEQDNFEATPYQWPEEIETEGEIEYFTDRPRPKRSTSITPNRQKCAGDKPKFRNGRRMARRELSDREEAAMCTG